MMKKVKKSLLGSGRSGVVDLITTFVPRKDVKLGL